MSYIWYTIKFLYILIFIWNICYDEIYRLDEIIKVNVCLMYDKNKNKINFFYILFEICHEDIIRPGVATNRDSSNCVCEFPITIIIFFLYMQFMLWTFFFWTNFLCSELKGHLIWTCSKYGYFSLVRHLFI